MRLKENLKSKNLSEHEWTTANCHRNHNFLTEKLANFISNGKYGIEVA